MIRALPLANLVLLLLFGLPASPSVAEDVQTLALEGANVNPSPTAAPLLDTVILASGGVIKP